MEPEKKVLLHAKTLVLKRNRVVEKEVGGDINVDGTVILEKIVASCQHLKGHSMVVLKDYCTIDHRLMQAQNTQEWCIKVWYGPHDWCLIPVKIIDHIEEVTRSQYE